MAATSTGQDGSFQLEAGPRSCLLTVRCPGFAPAELDHLLAGDDVLVRMDPEVLLLVSVIGPETAPVEGAELTIRPTVCDSPEDVRCRIRTDAAGRAATRAVSPGSWSLVVRHPDHAIAAASLEIPIGLPRIEKELRLERGTRLAGTVRTAEGVPIPAARILVESPYRDTFLLDEVLCDEEGRYATRPSFSLQETLEVRASAAGHAESTTWLGIQPHHERAGEAVVDFVLPRSGRTLRGRVIAGSNGVPGASIRVAVIETVGTSSQDTILALQLAPHAPWSWQECARTDPSGAFELTGLSASPQYILMAVGEPHAPRVVWAPPGTDGSVTELGDIELAASGSLFGRALHEDGSPAESQAITIYKANRVFVTEETSLGEWRPDAWFHPLETLTGADGRFRFDLLAPGLYQLPELGTELEEVEPGRATGPVEVVIERQERTVEVSGLVRDPAGEPVSMAFVRAFARRNSDEHLASSRLVDVRGAFSLEVPADSTARLVFTDLRGAHEERIVTLDTAARPAPLDIVLAERVLHLPPLDGLVFGPRGDALEGCLVTLHPPEDALCACIAFHARTDPAGAFRFQAADGPHRLVASDPRFATSTYSPAWPGDHVVIDLDER